MNTQPVLAAVDLGSNSFHMVVARLDAGELRPVATFKERVRLAAGLDERGMLTEESQARALACLRAFGQELHGLPPQAVRAVGTSTLRKARNALPFLLRAQRALGVRIDVITGRQEGLLIYRGVSRAPELEGRRLLVVDIGGGSTEVVLGEGATPEQVHSVDMGCVAYTGRYFPEGRVSGQALATAIAAGREALRAQLAPGGSWELARGSSGTLRAIERVLVREGWSPGDITAAGLERLRRELVRRGGPDGLQGLSASRAQVFAGGVAVASAVFDVLGLERLPTTERALREGVLEELAEALPPRAGLAA